MFLKKVKSEGLAHISYILGDGDRAAVIDPRRDVHIYLEIAANRGAKITHIFETHRIDELDKDRPVVTFCGSGARAVIAASILKKQGFRQVMDNLGSMAACVNIGCAVEKGKA